MRRELRLWLEQRVTAVHDAMTEHRERLDNLRFAMETGTAGWAPHQADLGVLVEARVTVDEAWVALRDGMGSLRAALALAASPDRRLVTWFVGDQAQDHLMDAIGRGQVLQGRLKRVDGRLRAMAFLYAGDATRPGLLGVEAAVARHHLAGAVQDALPVLPHDYSPDQTADALLALPRAHASDLHLVPVSVHIAYSCARLAIDHHIRLCAAVLRRCGLDPQPQQQQQQPAIDRARAYLARACALVAAAWGHTFDAVHADMT